MLYATDGTHRMEPTPGARAQCPLCRTAVRARCGQVNVWHWAHLQGNDCDAWAEPETKWHRAYKLIVPLERREVRIGRHRADVINPHGAVLELQHSPLSVDDIHQREDHYGPRMRWLFDARAPFWKERITVRHKRGDNGRGYVTFRWKHARRSITACTRPVILDLGQGLVLQVKKLYPGPPLRGWGHLIRTGDLWNWLLTGARPTSHLTEQPEAEVIKHWISSYATALGSRCGLTEPETADVLRETLFPPDGTITAVLLYALLSLQAEGKTPAGLERIVDGVQPVESRWLDATSIAFSCPVCHMENWRVDVSVTEPVLTTTGCTSCLAGVLVQIARPAGRAMGGR